MYELPDLVYTTCDAIMLFANTVCVSHTVEEVYHAITQCQMLYPDPEQSDSDKQGFEDEGEEEEEDNIVDLEGGEFFTSAEGFDLLSPHGLATLAHLERILQLPTPAEFEATLSNGQLQYIVYSGTSDKGPSEIGTTSLQRTLVAAPC